MKLNNRLQNKVAGSVATLPVCTALATILWWCHGKEMSANQILSWVLCMLAAYVTMETNNVFNLIRIRTRLTSSLWILMAASMPFMQDVRSAIAALCLSCSYFLLFRCYQMPRPEAFIYHAFLFLGIGLFISPVMLPTAVLFYAYLAGFLRSLTWKGFWAGLFGIATPAWCWFSWCLVTGNTERFLAYFAETIQTVPFGINDIASLPYTWMLSFGFMALLCIVGVAHFYLTNYNDKIRTRMMLYIYSLQTLFFLAAAIIQPSDFQTHCALLLVCGSPLIAHYFALTGSWLSNAFFVLMMFMYATVTFINIWMSSFTI